jgi:hypothetical protein
MENVSEMDEYLFDTMGYLLIKGAVPLAELAVLNAQLDAGNPAHATNSGLSSQTGGTVIKCPPPSTRA